MPSSPAACLDSILTGHAVTQQEGFLASWHDSLSNLLLKALTEPGVASFGDMTMAVIELNPRLKIGELRRLILAYGGEVPAAPQYDFRPSWYAALTYAFLRSAS